VLSDTESAEAVASLEALVLHTRGGGSSSSRSHAARTFRTKRQVFEL